jgi:hypothetical protein
MGKSALVAAAITGFMMTTVVHAADKAAAPADKAAATGECAGINSCKGKGECGGVGHSCSGKNACKGKGWVKKTEAECKAAKGKFTPSKA